MKKCRIRVMVTISFLTILMVMYPCIVLAMEQATLQKEPAIFMPLGMEKHYQFEIPEIGVYDPNGYHFSSLLAAITGPTIINALPESVISALANKFGYKDSGKKAFLQEKINSNQLHVSIAFFNELPESGAKRYNIVLHTVVRNWRGPGWFDVNIDAGIFEPQGVELVHSGGNNSNLGKNDLNPVNVIYHAPGHYSPDNAALSLESGRNVASFWLVGVAPDLNKAVVTFNILAATSQVQKLFDNAFEVAENKVLLRSKESKNILLIKTKEVIKELSKLTAALPNKNDQDILKDVIEKLTIATGAGISVKGILKLPDECKQTQLPRPLPTPPTKSAAALRPLPSVPVKPAAPAPSRGNIQPSPIPSFDISKLSEDEQETLALKRSKEEYELAHANELHKEKQKLKAIMQHSKSNLFSVDPETVTLSEVPQVKKSIPLIMEELELILGFSPEEVQGLSIKSVLELLGSE